MRQNGTITSYETLRKKAVEKQIPLHCLFELTYRCNLECIHCYVVRDEKCEVGDRKEELNTQEIFRSLNQLKEAGCLYLTFSGGEIFVRQDFFEIAEYARKLNFALRLFSNGTLINEKVADKIKKLSPVSVEISLYGFKNTHDKITKLKGSFDKTINAIRLLKQRGVKVFVKTMLMKQNVREIWKLQKFVKEKLKVNRSGIGGGLLLSPCDDGNRRPLDYRLTDEQLKKYIQEYSEQLKSSGEDYKPREVKENEFLCGAGFASCSITPYGELNPCVQVKLKDNSLEKKPLLEIYREHEGFKEFRDLRMADKKECWNCELLPYCFVCPGIALLEEGSLLAKLPEACRQAKIRKEIYEKQIE